MVVEWVPGRVGKLPPDANDSGVLKQVLRCPVVASLYRVAKAICSTHASVPVLVVGTSSSLAVITSGEGSITGTMLDCRMRSKNPSRLHWYGLTCSSPRLVTRDSTSRMPHTSVRWVLVMSLSWPFEDATM